MKQLSCLCLFITFIHIQIKAQQTVQLKLNQLMLDESFSEINDLWPVITNDDNFFVFDKGEFFMNRVKQGAPYALMSNWENDLNAFRIQASMMLGPSESNNQSIGLIVRASSDGQNALMVDINKNHRFRVRQLISGNYTTVTDDSKDGWIKNSSIKGINEYNDIEIRTNGKNHDVYINGALVFTFKIDDLNSGNIGLFIGPNTKARIDYISVYADEFYRDKNKIYLTDDEIRDLMYQNEKLELELEQSLDARAIELQNAIRILENQLKAMRLVNEQLDIENSQYAVIKSAIDTNQTQLLLDLSHKVINNTLENRQLKIEHKILNDSLKKVKSHYEDLELDLFQKVINVKTQEQLFIDSILTKFCASDTIYLNLDSTVIDSVFLNHIKKNNFSVDSVSKDISKPITE